MGWSGIFLGQTYPLPLVKTILESVMEKGDRTQREIARSHFDRLFGRTVSFGKDGPGP